MLPFDCVLLRPFHCTGSLALTLDNLNDCGGGGGAELPPFDCAFGLGLLPSAPLALPDAACDPALDCLLLACDCGGEVLDAGDPGPA